MIQSSRTETWLNHSDAEQTAPVEAEKPALALVPRGEQNAPGPDPYVVSDLPDSNEGKGGPMTWRRHPAYVLYRGMNALAIQAEIFRLIESRRAARLFLHLIQVEDIYSPSRDFFYRTQEKLEEEVGMSENTLREATGELVALKLVQVERRQQTRGEAKTLNYYRINWREFINLVWVTRTGKAVKRAYQVAHPELDRCFPMPAAEGGQTAILVPNKEGTAQSTGTGTKQSKTRTSNKDHLPYIDLILCQLNDPLRLGYNADYMPHRRTVVELEEIEQRIKDKFGELPEAPYGTILQQFFTQNWGRIYRHDMKVLTERINTLCPEGYVLALRQLVQLRSSIIINRYNR